MKEKMKTLEDIQKESFPKELRIEKCKFVSEMPNIVVKVRGKDIYSNILHVYSDPAGNIIKTKRVLVGHELIKFEGHEFYATNMLQVEALNLQPNVIKAGKIEPAKEVNDGEINETGPSRKRSSKR